MKKHLWLVVTIALCLVGVAYAAKQTLTVRTVAFSKAVTGSNGTAITRDTDTFAILNDVGRFSRANFTASIQYTDSVAGYGVLDSVIYGFYMEQGGIYLKMDSLTMDISADTASLAQKALSWSDTASGGFSRLKGTNLILIVRWADTTNAGAALGSDSALTSTNSWRFYFQE